MSNEIVGVRETTLLHCTGSPKLGLCAFILKRFWALTRK